MPGLSASEADTIRSVLDGDSEVLQALLQEEYEEIPVDPETFFTDPYYLGQTGADIYPILLDDLIEICRGDYVEIIMGGAIGYGKSTITEFGLLWVLYETLCLRNPQRSFGLMPASSIVLVNVSVNLSQAKKAIFSGILNKVRQSPFFKEVFPYDKYVTSELRFPKNVTIFPGASTDTSILGLNVIGGALDEGNFMPVQQKNRMTLNRVGSRGTGVYDKAETLYNAMIRRMKSRFMKHGRLPGKLFAISSAQYPNDFISRKVRKALHDDRMFVRSYGLWDVKRTDYSDETFDVEVGTDMQGSRILTGDEPEDSILGAVIQVPMDFFRDFENDIDGAIRDIAGISTLTVDQFIKNFTAVVKCVNTERRHPYTSQSTTLLDGAQLYRREYLTIDKATNEKTLRYNPQALRVVHIDTSVTGDATGIAVGHIADIVKVVRRKADGSEVVEDAPLIFFDLLLQVYAKKGSEIPFDRVRDILYQLQADGMNIKLATFDRFQSVEYGQQLRKRAIETDLLSIDRDSVPYETLKQAFYENRVDMYNYKPALRELRRLEHDRSKNKVDHPAEDGSKDVSDAMAGVAYNLTIYAGRLYRPKIVVDIF